nr:MAG TPA: hypothetical protein [Caudoviricetes sp.]
METCRHHHLYGYSSLDSLPILESAIHGDYSYSLLCSHLFS